MLASLKLRLEFPCKPYIAKISPQCQNAFVKDPLAWGSFWVIATETISNNDDSYHTDKIIYSFSLIHPLFQTVSNLNWRLLPSPRVTFSTNSCSTIKADYAINIYVIFLLIEFVKARQTSLAQLTGWLCPWDRSINPSPDLEICPILYPLHFHKAEHRSVSVGALNALKKWTIISVITVTACWEHLGREHCP